MQYLVRMLTTSSSYFVKLKYLCNSGRKSWHKMTCVETLLKTIYGIFNSRSKTANNILRVLCIVISSSEVIYLHIIRGHTHSYFRRISLAQAFYHNQSNIWKHVPMLLIYRVAVLRYKTLMYWSNYLLYDLIDINLYVNFPNVQPWYTYSQLNVYNLNIILP